MPNVEGRPACDAVAAGCCEIVSASRMRAWTSRPATEGDVDELIALHHRVFGHTISREHWLWKLMGRPGPVANVWVAELDGRIIFQCAGIPTRVRHLGTECWAMVAVDTMTHPDFQRRGVLSQVGAATYAGWKQAGIPFIVGLPNERWGSRKQALGWVRISELRRWSRLLDPIRAGAARWGGLRQKESFERAVDGRHGCRSLQLSAVEDPEGLAELWSTVRDEGVVRDPSWFRWRYFAAPRRWEVLGAWESGRLIGAATLRIDAKTRGWTSGAFGEVVAARPAVLRALLSRGCQRLKRVGAWKAVLHVQPGTELEPAALATGFVPSQWSFSVDAIDLGGGLPLPARFQGSDFDVA